MTYLLVALLALSLGWVSGHRTARIKIINVGPEDTAEAVAAVALAAACCEMWWTSAGAEHDTTCTTTRRAA